MNFLINILAILAIISKNQVSASEDAETKANATHFEFSQNQIEAIFGAKQPTIILFRTKDDENSDFMKVFEEASLQLDHKGWLFVYAGFEDNLQTNLGNFMNIAASDLPTLRAM